MSPVTAILCLSLGSIYFTSNARAFEGCVAGVLTRGGGQGESLLYTFGANFSRVEIVNAPDSPMPVDIVNINSGQLTLLFPQNRSFVRLPAAESRAEKTPAQIGFPTMPARPMPETKMELRVSGQGTNILGFACKHYELKQRGQMLEIWATDQLPPFQPYVRNQSHHHSSSRIEEQWEALLAARKLFPLLAILRHDNGGERFRFEIKSVTPRKFIDEDLKLFQPPPGYSETQPLPF